MQRKKHDEYAYDISEEEFCELCKQPGAHAVVEAVRRYNAVASQSRYFEEHEVDALLKKAAEETDAKLFLDGIFDLAENNSSFDSTM